MRVFSKLITTNAADVKVSIIQDPDGTWAGRMDIEQSSETEEEAELLLIEVLEDLPALLYPLEEGWEEEEG